MIPSRIAGHEHLPRTSSGKVDYPALRALAMTVGDESNADMPPGLRKLARIWERTLDLPSVQPQDDFIELGGDSLSMTMLAGEIEKEFLVSMTLQQLRGVSRLDLQSDLVAKIEGSNAGPNYRLIPRGRQMPLSYGQEMIWRHSRHAEAARGYTVSRKYRITGSLNIDALRSSLTDLIRRHEILRTTYHQREDGGLVQEQHEPYPVELAFEDFSCGANPISAAWAWLLSHRRVYDLASLPSVHCSLAKVGQQEHFLLWSNHHIGTDRWSFEQLIRELGVLYEARLRGVTSELEPVAPDQFSSYAFWERERYRRGTVAHRELIAWWTERLSKAPADFDAALRHACASSKAKAHPGRLDARIEPAVNRRLDRLARDERTTFHGMRMAGLSAAWAAATGCKDIVLGEYLPRRGSPQLQSMIGYLISLTAVRLQIEVEMTFRQWIREARRVSTEAEERSGMPFDWLCEEIAGLGLTRPPAIRVIVTRKDINPCRRFGGVEMVRVSPHDFQETEESRKLWLARNIPWGFSVTSSPALVDQLSLFEFDSRIYDPARVQVFMELYTEMMRRASINPDLTIKNLSMGLIALEPVIQNPPAAMPCC